MTDGGTIVVEGAVIVLAIEIRVVIEAFVSMVKFLRLLSLLFGFED